MTDAEVDARLDYLGTPAPSVKPRDIEEAIKKVDYYVFPDTTLTLCCITMYNGFTVTGESACAAIENFDAELGRKLALTNAKNKIWLLLGFLLREQLYQESNSGNG